MSDYSDYWKPRYDLERERRELRKRWPFRSFDREQEAEDRIREITRELRRRDDREREEREEQERQRRREEERRLEREREWQEDHQQEQQEQQEPPAEGEVEHE